MKIGSPATISRERLGPESATYRSNRASRYLPGILRRTQAAFRVQALGTADENGPSGNRKLLDLRRQGGHSGTWQRDNDGAGALYGFLQIGSEYRVGEVFIRQIPHVLAAALQSAGVGFMTRPDARRDAFAVQQVDQRHAPTARAYHRYRCRCITHGRASGAAVESPSCFLPPIFTFGFRSGKNALEVGDVL